MKAISSSVKHSYLAKIGILLIVIALVAGIVSCNGAATYELTMAENPAEGGTATDETGGSPYARADVVEIKAVPNPCYRFVGWTTSAGTLGNASALETTITIPAEDVTVTANFEPVPPDHFKFYEVDEETAPYVGEEVQLVDQFGTFNVTVGEAYSFGNPVQKIHNNVTTPISDENRHYTLYELDYGEEEPMLDSWQVTVTNQFQDNVELTVVGPYYLAVPTQKEDHEMVECLNHYLVYVVDEGDYYEFDPVEGVNLKDQFIPDGEDVMVWGPYLFANPVEKTIVETGDVAEIEDPDLHWVLYDIWDEDAPSIGKSIDIVNQFDNQTLNLTYPELLAVPSEKISWEQPLNHFKTYWAEWAEEPPMYGVDVQLKDQFIAEWLGEPLNATVWEPFLFANPTSKEKMVGEEEFEWTPVSDWQDHLTFYWIDYEEEEQTWEVTVNNQFGNNQWLEVYGPLWLAVPTGKLAPDWPADLNHYLVYLVIDYEFVPEEFVYLHDQFTGQETMVWDPAFFAVPAQKIHDGVVTDIKDDKHLLFYGIGSGEFIAYAYDLPVVNQFGQQYLDVWELEFEDNFLGVPSETFTEADALAVAAVLGDCDSQLTTLLLSNNIWAEERGWDVISDIDDYDVVVINMPVDPGETTFLDFLDAASGNQTGVIFTSSYSVDASWGISLLELYLSDPGGQSEDFGEYDPGDVYYKVTQEHPIFDGWNVDDEITIITGGEYNDHAWFWDYSGSTIADVGWDDDGIQGDAVAVGTYGGSTHVLLASLGPQVDTDMTYWTDDAKTIFINAVLYAI
jgi:uncharacterized repeat protein (TIGR02543 family)